MVMQIQTGALTPAERQFFADRGIEVQEVRFQREQPLAVNTVAREYDNPAPCTADEGVEILIEGLD